jgi:DUF3014 family protein
METPRTSLRRPSPAPWVVLALALVAAGAGYLFMRAGGGKPDATPPIEPVAADAGGEAAASPTHGTGDAGLAAAPDAGATAPPSDIDPARVQELLDPVSHSPLVRLGLAQGALVRRWVVVTDALAEGDTPRRELGFLAPSRPFSVAASGGRSVIAPASYARYDAFGDAVASVDAAAVAKAYRELHGVLEAAYRALGYPDAALDDVTGRALRRVVAAPVVDGEVEVVNDEGLFVYADRRLEDLGEVEKHLLRMGPRNGRLIAAKARELLLALRLPAEGPTSR